MFNFILQILLLVSFGLMVYLVARKIPVISDTIEEGGAHRGIFAKTENFLSSIPYDKIDFLLSQFLEKTLRKTKLYLLKLDNQLNKHLEKFKNVKMQTHLRKEKKLALFDNLYKENGKEENELTEEIDIKPENEEERKNSDIII